MTFGFHLCRGNQDSRWLVAGGYDGDRGADLRRRPRRSGCCSSTTTSARAASTRCALVPDDKLVVLGLVTTKSPRRETEEELEARVREARRSSGSSGWRRDAVRLRDVGGRQRAAVEDERRKLALIARTAAADLER